MTFKYCDVDFFLQGRDTHMRQIKVHSPVQDRIGGTGASVVIQFQNISNEDYRKRRDFLFICQFCVMFVLGSKHSVKNSDSSFTFLEIFVTLPFKNLELELCICFFFWPLMPFFPQCHQRTWQSSLRWRWKCIRLFDDPYLLPQY